MTRRPRSRSILKHMKFVPMESYCTLILPKLSHWLNDTFFFSHMTVVEKTVGSADIASRYHDYHRDTLTLTWEQRRQGHGRRVSDAGLAFAMSLPGGTILKSGDCMILEPEQTIVSIKEVPEPVYIVRPTTPQDWAYYAYHVGNRHQE